MTLQQIIYFIEVARTRHFTQAAQNLYVSQSALSYSVQALERELGIELFTRASGKKVNLTQYGKEFLPFCEKTVQTLKEGQEKIDEMKNPMSGIVNIVYSYTNCYSLIPSVFNDFYAHNSYEDITVRFEVNHGKARYEETVLSGEADLAFACTKSFDGLDATPIAKQDLVLMMPVNHPLAGRKSVSLREIKDDNIIWYYRGSNLYRWIERMFELEGIKPNFTTDLADWSAQMAHISLGMGVTISPRMPVDSQFITQAEIESPLNKRNIYMLSSKDKMRTPAVEYVRQYCIDWSREHYGVITEA